LLFLFFYFAPKVFQFEKDFLKNMHPGRGGRGIGQG